MDSIASIERCFADNYVDARQNFLQACSEKNIPVSTYVNESAETKDVELACDVVRIGEEKAEKLLVLTSGVHGAELMCGSGCQVGMIRHGLFNMLPTDTAVLMIHAINPWGAANIRRNNEDNIDLCRNFVDFNSELPISDAYTQIHDALNCSQYKGHERDKAQKLLNEFREINGPAKFIGAIMSGQFQYADGFSFGGHEATWSHKTLLEIIQLEAANATKVCLVDYHSGLGPYGYGEAVCMQNGAGLSRACDWFGEWVTAPMEDVNTSGEKFHPALGHTTEGYMRTLCHAEITSIVIEFGTFDMQSNLQALLDDHWLTLHGERDSEEGKQIKEHMLRTHYPDDPEWRYAVWNRSGQVIRQAMRGLQDD